MLDESEDKLLIKISKILFPDQFENDNTFYERGRMFKLVDLQESLAYRLPKSKFLFSKYHIRLIYREKLKNVRLPKQKEWISCYEINPYIDLPIISIVKRDVVIKGITEVMDGMVNVFKANVLIVKDFKYVDFERLALKTMFKLHGIVLIYEDEINF